MPFDLPPSQLEELCKKSEKINGELIVLMYGALVSQVCKDFPTALDANQQLEKIGISIGHRIIEDFLCKCIQVGAFGQTLGVNPKVEMKCIGEFLKAAFKFYLSINASILYEDEKHQLNLTLDNNPFQEHVEIPNELKTSLSYCSILCGIIRGSLEMLRTETVVSQAATRTFTVVFTKTE